MVFWMYLVIYIPSFESRASQTVQSGVQSPRPAQGLFRVCTEAVQAGTMVMGRVALRRGRDAGHGGGRNANVSVSR